MQVERDCQALRATFNGFLSPLVPEAVLGTGVETQRAKELGVRQQRLWDLVQL